MDNIAIEAKADMEAVSAPVEVKTEMEGANLPPPVTVAVTPSES